MPKVSLVGLLSLCVVTAVSGQAPAVPKPAPAPTPNTEAAYTIDTLRTRVRFETDGTGTREMALSVRVLDEQAVRQWGRIRCCTSRKPKT